LWHEKLDTLKLTRYLSVQLKGRQRERKKMRGQMNYHHPKGASRLLVRGERVRVE
jgi:hypothetical protein